MKVITTDFYLIVGNFARKVLPPCDFTPWGRGSGEETGVIQRVSQNEI